MTKMTKNNVQPKREPCRLLIINTSITNCSAIVFHHAKILSPYEFNMRNTFSGKPGIPRHLEAVSTGPDSVQLVWDVPSNDGGAPIDNYVIEKREASRNVWAAQGTSDRTTYTANNLHEGYQYYFRVAAENSVGMGDFAEMTTSIIPKAPFSKYRKRGKHILVM